MEPDVTAPLKEQEDPETPITDFSKNMDGQNSDETDFSGLPSLLEQHGADYEAEAFARQKEAESKRRKRKGRRM